MAEPEPRSSSASRPPSTGRRLSPRRLTLPTMEGWSNVRDSVRASVYMAVSKGVNALTVEPRYDAAGYHEEDDDGDDAASSRTRRGRSSKHTSTAATMRSVMTTSTNSRFSGFSGRELPAGVGVGVGTDYMRGASDGGAAYDAAYNKEQQWQSQQSQSQPQNPFDDRFVAEKAEAAQPQNPFEDPEPPLAGPPAVEEPYSAFSPGRKRLLVGIIGVAGLFSGLSSNIYFPALDAISLDLGVSLGAVSLTITSYLIIQGISPLFWGSLSDALGRRPIYIASFVVYIIANIGLSFSPNFAVLLIFRGLQSAGSASTVSIGNGVIQDISPASERGAYISFYQAIRNFSIAIGPVIGGGLLRLFGFRSIFIFLLILSGIVLVMILLFLPETMRSVAGNGSLRLGGIYQPWVWKITGGPSNLVEPDEPMQRKKITAATFVEPLRLLGEKDILSNLIFGGVVYTIWSMVTASTTGLFKSRFGLDEAQLGLIFLPNGLGTIVGSTVIGKLMTRDFRRATDAYKIRHDLPQTYKVPPKDLPVDFPIEHARLRNLPWISALFAASTAAYGFSLAFPGLTSLAGWIAVPLTLQFLIAATSNAVFALNQTLVSDLCPGKGASSTAINNLVRCGLGAVGVAFIDTMLATVGPAAAFLGLGLIGVSFFPLAVVSWYWGMEWRERRVVRLSRGRPVVPAEKV